jgi:ribosomal protein S12 methylthiotransferase
VRLHYVYPYPHVDDLLPLMAEGLVLPYLDIPFQHASQTILKSMRRPAHAEKVLERIVSWRRTCPELAIRSTFIVGFPGETEADFQELLAFIEEARIDRAGCFRYSHVEGAAANALPDPVAEEVSEERYHRFMQAQMKISAARLEEKIGTSLEVIIDSLEDGVAIGRTKGDAPEVDGVVTIIEPPATFLPGTIAPVRITGSSEYDLTAVAVS